MATFDPFTARNTYMSFEDERAIIAQNKANGITPMIGRGIGDIAATGVMPGDQSTGRAINSNDTYLSGLRAQPATPTQTTPQQQVISQPMSYPNAQEPGTPNPVNPNKGFGSFTGFGGGFGGSAGGKGNSMDLGNLSVSFNPTGGAASFAKGGQVDDFYSRGVQYIDGVPAYGIGGALRGAWKGTVGKLEDVAKPITEPFTDAIKPILPYVQYVAPFIPGVGTALAVGLGALGSGFAGGGGFNL
jgi:hypothetical protein